MKTPNNNLTVGFSYLTFLALKSINDRTINQSANKQKPKMLLLSNDDSGSCGNSVNYTFTASTGELDIHGSGDMNTNPWSSYKTNIKSVIIEYGVSNIMERAFYGCSSLITVIISNGVTSIGSEAFSYCSLLTTISIPDSVISIGSSAFYYCSSLTTIIISNSVTSIESYAFSYCSSLTTITIPDSVTSIDVSAFTNCNKLTYIYIDKNNNYYTSILGVVYSKDVDVLIICPAGKNGSFSIPDSVTSIGSYAFYLCSSLTAISIPDNVTSIGSYAFFYCSSITTIYIPESVTSIGPVSFSYCPSLTTISIPNRVTSIESATFSYCFSLTTIVIPDSVTSIGSSAFYYCSSLTKVVIPDSVTSIGSDAFNYCPNLNSVTYFGKTEPEHGTNVFDKSSSLQFVYVYGRYKNHTFCEMPIKKLDIIKCTQNIPYQKYRSILTLRKVYTS